MMGMMGTMSLYNLQSIKINIYIYLNNNKVTTPPF